MGVCRFWVYVIAGSTGAAGVNGGPIWCGVALAFYVAGMGYLAQRESFRGPGSLLAADPAGRAHRSGHDDEFGGLRACRPCGCRSCWLLWMARCVRTIFQAGDGQRCTHGVGSAGGNCFRGLAGRRAALPAMAEYRVPDVVWRDAVASTFRAGRLNGRIEPGAPPQHRVATVPTFQLLHKLHLNRQQFQLLWSFAYEH